MPKKWSFYGDEWLCLRDQFDKLDSAEAVVADLNFNYGLLSPKEIAYLIGDKTKLIGHIAFMGQLNRIYRKMQDNIKDPIKSREAFEKFLKDRKLVTFTQQQQKQGLQNSMFQ